VSPEITDFFVPWDAGKLRALTKARKIISLT
jgi:hypothetical protein